jgi:hypothetical protein
VLFVRRAQAAIPRTPGLDPGAEGEREGARLDAGQAVQVKGGVGADQAGGRPVLGATALDQDPAIGLTDLRRDELPADRADAARRRDEPAIRPAPPVAGVPQIPVGVVGEEGLADAVVGTDALLEDPPVPQDDLGVDRPAARRAPARGQGPVGVGAVRLGVIRGRHAASAP